MADLGEYYVGVGLDVGDFNSNMSGALSGLQSAAQAMVAAMQTVVSQIENATSSASAGFQSAADSAKASAENMTGSAGAAVVSMKESFSSLRAGVGGMGIAVAAALGEATKKVLEFDESVVQLHRQTGMTLEDASAWMGIARMWGVSSQSMTMGIRSLSRQLEQAKKSVNDTNSVFTRYHITIKDATTGALLPMNEILGNVAEKVKQLGYGQAATAVATTAFGRAGMQLLPFLHEGKEGIEKVTVAMQKYGILMHDDSAFEAYKQATRDFNLASLGMEVQLSSVLMPVLVQLAGLVTKVTQAYNDLSQPVKDGLTTFITFGSMVAILAGGMAALKAVMSALGFAELASKVTMAINPITAMKTGVTMLTTAFTEVRAALSLLPAAFAGGLGGLRVWCAMTGLATIATTLMWVAIAAIILIVAGLAIAWATNFNNIRQATADSLGKIWEGFKTMGSSLVEWCNGIIHMIHGAFTLNWDEVKSGSAQFLASYQTYWSGIKAVALNGCAFIKTAVVTTAAGIKEMFSMPKAPEEGPPGGDDGEGRGTGKAKSDKGKSAYEKAKQIYEKEIQLAQYSAQEKEAIYTEMLANITKSEEEAYDYKAGLYKLDYDAVKEGIENKEALLENQKISEHMDDATYAGKSLAIKKEALTNEVNFEVNSRMNLANAKATISAKDQAVLRAGITAEVMGQTNVLKLIRAVLEESQKLVDVDTQLAKIQSESTHASDSDAIESMKKYYDLQKSLGLTSVAEDTANQSKIVAMQEAADQAQLDRDNQQVINDNKDLDKKTVAYQAYINNKNAITMKAAQQQTAIANAATVADKQRMITLASDISNAYGSCVRGILTGTKAIGSAIREMGQSILTSYVTMVTQPMLDHFKQMLTKKLVANKASGSAEVVADKAQQMAITAGRAAAATTQITTAKGAAKAAAAAGAASATAIVTANAAAFAALLAMVTAMATAIALIPPAGPAMASAMMTGVGTATTALTAATTVASTGIGASMANVASFDTGTWSVPHDMLAMVHKGEPIIPAPFADKARSVLSGEMVPAGSSGGMTVQVVSSPQVSMIDTKGAKAFFDQHANVLADTISKRLVRTFKYKQA